MADGEDIEVWGGIPARAAMWDAAGAAHDAKVVFDKALDAYERAIEQRTEQRYRELLTHIVQELREGDDRGGMSYPISVSLKRVRAAITAALAEPTAPAVMADGVEAESP